MVIYWLYNITGDKFLLELGDLVHQQTLDWTMFLEGTGDDTAQPAYCKHAQALRTCYLLSA